MELMAMDDVELLWEYGRSRSPEAFATVAARYVDLIYSAALRQVRDPHVADDVTQAVLIVMMNKASKLPPGTILAGWLLKVTRYASLDVMKLESRRKRHEQAAAHDRAAAPPSTWEQIAPVMDEALLKLKSEDRDAVVLRFLMNKSPEEIAWVMGVSEEAARQRVSRAIQKLRDIFARRGITTMEDALGAVLSANAVLPAPPAMAAIAKSIAAAGSGGSAPPSVIAKGTAKMLNSAKMKIAVTSAIGTTIIVVTVVLLLLHLTAKHPQQEPSASALPKPKPAPQSVARRLPPGLSYETPPHNLTRLILAAHYHDTEAVRRFISLGDDVNAISSDGNDAPALVYAAFDGRDGSFEIIRLLLDAGG